MYTFIYIFIKTGNMSTGICKYVDDGSTTAQVDIFVGHYRVQYIQG